jgi:hypothetical protein
MQQAASGGMTWMISVHIGYCELSRDQALNIVAYLTVGSSGRPAGVQQLRRTRLIT